MTGPKETVYDEKIAPLMKQVIALCRAGRIPAIFNFELDDETEGVPLFCTTYLNGDGFDSSCDKLQRMMDVARPPEPKPLVVKTFDGDGKLTNYTVIV